MTDTNKVSGKAVSNLIREKLLPPLTELERLRKHEKFLGFLIDAAIKNIEIMTASMAENRIELDKVVLKIKEVENGK